MNSGLPLEILGKIWDLSDVDRDGQLDRHEFTAVSLLCRRIFDFILMKSCCLQSMHLVYKVLDNYPLPPTLPRELMPPHGDAAIRRGSGFGGPTVAPSVSSPSEALKVRV